MQPTYDKQGLRTIVERWFRREYGEPESSDYSSRTPLRVKELQEPVYELSIGGMGKHCSLVAEVYASYGSSIRTGKYLVTNFWRLGPQKLIRRDSGGFFEQEDLENLIVEVEEEYGPIDQKGKPFFVNAFLFTRMTGTGESPIEFYQIDVDRKSKTREE